MRYIHKLYIFTIIIFLVIMKFSSIYTYAKDDIEVETEAINTDKGTRIEDAIVSSIVTVDLGQEPEILENIQEKEIPNVEYNTHVENIGWQGDIHEGKTAGTEGQSKRVEAIRINLKGSDNIKVKYRTHVQDIGWMNWVNNGEMSGTTGQSKRIEAIQIKLENTEEYSIMYRVHVQDIGWMDWTYNGNIAGTVGQSKRIEAIQIKIIENAKVPPTIKYEAHIQDIGWQSSTSEGNIAGTEGQSLRMEALKIKINNDNTIKIKYRTHIQDIGWQNWKYNGEIAGTEGQSKRVEAIQILLENTEIYSIAYRVHVQDIGWMDWMYDGNIAGTVGQSKRIEAIQIKIIKKAEKSVYWGIDVSNWQGDIDWDTVKKSGVEFAILRIGYGRNSNQLDKSFERNYSECKRLNIPIGIYLYSYATDEEGAMLEAQNCINWLNGRDIDLPIFYDLEDDSMAGLSRDAITNMTIIFTDRIQQEGYIPGVYASAYWLDNKIDVSRLDNCEIWLAHWTYSTLIPSYYIGRYSIWQYSDCGAIDGISGDVDLDIRYAK